MNSCGLYLTVLFFPEKIRRVREKKFAGLYDQLIAWSIHPFYNGQLRAGNESTKLASYLLANVTCSYNYCISVIS